MGDTIELLTFIMNLVGKSSICLLELMLNDEMKGKEVICYKSLLREKAGGGRGMERLYTGAIGLSSPTEVIVRSRRNLTTNHESTSA